MKAVKIMNMKILPITALVLITSIFPTEGEYLPLRIQTNAAYAGKQKSIPVYGYEVVNTYPHDTGAFTQGLVFDNGTLYESTGIKGRSAVRKVDLKTGKVLKSYNLPDKYFGEGIAIVGSRIVQLTWRSRKGFVYDKNTFDVVQSFNYPTEGWGITYDGRNLIMSDGSATLYFLNPDSFNEVGRLEVYDNKGAVSRLNELEYVNGEIMANVWGTDRIAKIDPGTGRVTAWIELNGLLRADERKNRDVLNGIAYDPGTNRLFVTGKLWPRIFEIKLVPEK